MKNTKNIAIFILLTSVILFWNCNGTKKDNTIKIGATLDFTGPNAVYGEQVKQGIDLAIEEINKEVGAENKHIEIIYQDSKSDPKIAVNNAQKFTSVDGIKIIIGEISSSATLSMIPVIEQNKAFLFAPASSSPKLTNVSNNFARNWPSDVAEAGNAAEFAFRQFSSKNPIIVYVNSDYGIGLKNKFEETFSKLGGIVAGSESYEVNTSDFRTLIIKLKQKKLDCIYLAGNPKEMGNFMKQLSESGIKTNIISNSGFIQPDCLNLAGQFSEDVIVPTPSYLPNDSSNVKATQFYNLFKQKYNREPTLSDANGYDGIYLISGAIKKVGYDGIKVAEYIRNLKNYDGVAGKVSFINGDVERQIVFKIIKNGKAINY